MKRIIAAALAIAALSLQSCTFVRFNGDGSGLNGSRSMMSASGVETIKTFELPSFKKVTVQVHGDIVISQSGGASSARVTFAENLMEYLRFDVEGDELIIKMDDSNKYRYSDMDIFLETPDLNAVTLQGSGDIEITNLVTDTFAVTIQGAGDVDVDHIECGRLDAVIQGAGDIEITGKASSAGLTIQGAGDIDVKNLVCDDITSSVQGAGAIERK